MRCSLRSLMIVVTLIAVPLGWWNNRSTCLEWSNVHFEEGAKQSLYSVNPCDSTLTKHKHYWLKRVSAHHFSIARSYRRAANRPWERLWIDVTLPEPPPATTATSALLYP
jgi:hypothetical protein